MAAPKEIVDLVERFENNYDAYKSLSYNEEDIKMDFINPLFEALGWDIGNKNNMPPELREVKFEDSVEVQGRIKNPDYSFRLDRTRRFFVEAKKPAVNIEHGINPAFQLRSYAWSATLPLSIVTDFEEFAVYDCRSEPSKLDKPTKSRLLIIKYYEFEKRWDEIASIFSKEAVQNGSLDRYLDSIPAKRGSKKVDEALLEDISGWREALAVNIAKMNPSLGQKSLNHAIQMTIDRILFLRICEDRSIEDYGRLKNLIDGENVYARLFELFEEADKRYNSGLFHFHVEEGRNNFDTITPSIDIEDEVLKEIIRELYYPDSPYVFSEIPAEILGQVYEQFWGKVIQVDENREVEVIEKPEVKKAGGIYYTPSYVVDYIVKNTVGKLLEEKRPKEASELRILDPACGSGSFLIGAYQYLLDWHLDWYKRNLVPLLDAGQKLTSKEVQGLLPAPIEKPGKNARAISRRIWERASVATLPIEQRTEEWHLRTAERKRILLNNIHGVDIDTQAVEVTKLSLLLKVLEGENKATIADLTMYSDERALPDLGNNIKCGNSLIEWDIQKERQNLTREDLNRINPFDWDIEFPEVFKRGGFDVVIGNPPYIPIEMMDEIQRAYYKTHCPQLERKYDSSIIFIILTLKKLNKGGLLGFISSITWQTGENFRKLREHIFTNNGIIALVNLPFDVFKNAYVDTGVYILSRAPAEHYYIFRYPKKEKTSSLENLMYAKIPRHLIISPEYKIILEPHALNISLKMNSTEHFSPLGSFTISTQGLAGNRFEKKEEPNGDDWYPYLATGQVYSYAFQVDQMMFTDLSEHPSLKPFYESQPKILIRRVINRQDRLMATYTDQKMVFKKDINPFIIVNPAWNPM
ncbi:MAG: restriction endonuclease subunit M [Methanothrix sp.]|nr:MAG: restriction endonuclease subunit M [Methanothrix sp.]